VLLAAHIPIHYAGKMANPRRSAKRDMQSRDRARSAIGMGHSSWNRAKLVQNKPRSLKFNQFFSGP